MTKKKVIRKKNNNYSNSYFSKKLNLCNIIKKESKMRNIFFMVIISFLGSVYAECQPDGEYQIGYCCSNSLTSCGSAIYYCGNVKCCEIDSSFSCCNTGSCQ